MTLVFRATMKTMPNHNQLAPTHGNPRHALCKIALLMVLTVPVLAGPPTTTTSCASVDGKLKYACDVMLMHNGQPLSGADITQRADMPSMPLTHNIPPTWPAENLGKPGHYGFEVELEMHGQWMFTYDLQSPLRERVHEKITFVPGDDSASMEHSKHSGHTNHTNTTQPSTN